MWIELEFNFFSKGKPLHPHKRTKKNIFEGFVVENEKYVFNDKLKFRNRKLKFHAFLIFYAPTLKVLLRIHG
jgi:hypothetical protein